VSESKSGWAPDGTFLEIWLDAGETPDAKVLIFLVVLSGW